MICFIPIQLLQHFKRYIIRVQSNADSRNMVAAYRNETASAVKSQHCIPPLLRFYSKSTKSAVTTTLWYFREISVQIFIGSLDIKDE